MSQGSIILYMPLILSAYMDISPTAKGLIDRNPNIPLVSYLKDTFTKGVQLKHQFVELRSDFEVYIGLYLIIVWFLGWSNLI